jgi:hypothetical protein
MIGERIESSRRLPWGALLLVVGGLGLGAVGLAVRSATMANVAILPLALGLTGAIRARARTFAASFTSEAIVVEGAAATIPYTSIRNVWAHDLTPDPSGFQSRSCPLRVHHEAGRLDIPARLNVRSDRVYAFLAGQLSACGGRDVHPALADYLRSQEAAHGRDAIATYCAARQSARPAGYRRFRTFCIGVILAGSAWMALGFSQLSPQGWDALGVVCTVTALVLFVLSFAMNASISPRIKHRDQSSLVIGPEGLAMVQGDIQGVIRWPELLQIKYRPPHRTFQLSASSADLLTGIILRVTGAEIAIADIYDRPLYVIHDQILAASGKHESVEPRL